MRTALLVLVLGCGGGGKKAAEAPKDTTPTCAAVADAMIGIMLLNKEQTPKLKETMDGFTAIIRTRCEADGWTAEAKTCLAAMKTQPDAERCAPMLTEEQQANLVRDEKAKYGAPAEAESEAARQDATAPASRGAPPPPEPKAAKKGSPKPGDPCDGGE